MRLAGIVRRVHQIQARLVNSNRVQRDQNADVLHARIFRHSAAVAVDRHVLHHVDKDHVALEIVHDRGRRVRHGVEELILLCRPHLVGLARAVDIRLAVGRGAADGQLLQCAAEAAHRVALEVRQNQHGVIVRHVLANEVLLNLLAVRNCELQIGSLGVQQVDREALRPAVLLHGLAVLFGGVALAGIGGVALDNRAVHAVDHRLPKIRAQEVLVSLLAGVYLHCDLTGQRLARLAIELYHLFRCNFS